MAVLWKWRGREKGMTAEGFTAETSGGGGSGLIKIHLIKSGT